MRGSDGIGTGRGWLDLSDKYEKAATAALATIGRAMAGYWDSQRHQQQRLPWYGYNEKQPAVARARATATTSPTSHGTGSESCCAANQVWGVPSVMMLDTLQIVGAQSSIITTSHNPHKFHNSIPPPYRCLSQWPVVLHGRGSCGYARVAVQLFTGPPGICRENPAVVHRVVVVA